MDVPDLAAQEETGALGVMHLKRYWSQVLASRAGAGSAEPPERPLDTVVLCGLQAGIHETLSYLMQQVPTFPQFEEWILARNGGSIEPERVARINAAVMGTLAPGIPPAVGSAEAALTAEDLEFWDRNGYVVLHDAVTPEQCDSAARAIYEFLKVDPADPETWYANPNGHTIWVALLRHRAFRANRESARIHAAFAQLWARTDLWASIDQGGFNPPERPGWRFPGPHLHWDTSIALPMPFGVQGILYLTDTAADQGAFQCVPGFQRRLADWLAELPPGTDPRNRQLMDKLGAVPIAGHAGDLIIWHHALPHGSSPNRSTRPRVAQYIRMTPSNWETNPVWL
jgi:ectoine hydroxylase-related dioxygenase (phytanoyl-CoA dioxygenase family)